MHWQPGFGISKMKIHVPYVKMNFNYHVQDVKYQEMNALQVKKIQKINIYLI